MSVVMEACGFELFGFRFGFNVLSIPEIQKDFNVVKLNSGVFQYSWSLCNITNKINIPSETIIISAEEVHVLQQKTHFISVFGKLAEGLLISRLWKFTGYVCGF